MANAVKIKDQNIERNAEEALRNCLALIPFLRIESIQKELSIGPAQLDGVFKLNGTVKLGGEIKVDLLITLSFSGGEQQIVVEAKNSGQPRFAREAANLLSRLRTINQQIYGVFMAPYVSPKAAEILSREGVGYIDFSGNCRLSFDQVYVERTGNPNPFSEKRDLRSLYSPKASRVLRVLLLSPQRRWKVQEIAEQANVSMGQVSNVKKLLYDREWIRTYKEGFVLSEPEELLVEWSDNYKYEKNKIRNYYSLKSVAEIEAELADACGRKGLNFALTGFSAAARYAPAVRYQRVTAYVEETEEDIASMLNLKEVSSGANVSLLTPYDEGVFYGSQDIQGIKIVSPVQVYLDLVSSRGRGEEAADSILNNVIRQQW